MIKHRTPDIMSSLANTAAMSVTKTVERINMAVPQNSGKNQYGRPTQERNWNFCSIENEIQLFHDDIEKGRSFNSIPLRKGIGAIAVLKMKYFIFVLQTEQLFHDIIEKGRYFNSIPLRKGIGTLLCEQ